MAVDLTFERGHHSTPWGFRLTGGADLNLPLTVIRVSEESIAEESGMKVGDLLVRVNETATAGLTHLQVHDLIKDAGNLFTAAIIRGIIPEQITETEQTIDSETSHSGVSQTVQINIKANVVDTTQIIVETDEVLEQNIKINGTVIEQEENVGLSLNREEKLSEEITVEKTSEEIRTEIKDSQTTNTIDVLGLEKFMQTPECIKTSEVLKVLNEDKEESEEQMKEKRWTTFLQKPDRPKPKIKQKEDDEPKKDETNENYYEEHVLLTRLLSIVQEPPYRVIIQKQKKKRDAEKSNESSQMSTPVPIEMTIETPEVPETKEEDDEEKKENEEFESKNDVEDNIEGTEQVNEVELSLEEQLSAIQQQLLALSQLPAAIQQTLDVVTQQLTKIVGPVNDPNTEEEETEAYLEETFEETEEKTTELETLEELSESGFDRDSQEEEETTREGEEKEDIELEMLQVTPEPEEDLTPEEREARRVEQEIIDKKQKENPIISDLRHRRSPLTLTPLQRPICLPGGRRWLAPEDAETRPNANMSDELIAETISAQTEVLVGTTLGDSNTHLVPSKAIETKKINFLKFQPPPKSLEHLKHSEVYRLVHDMDQPARGVGARQGKAVAEEDVYAQVRNNSQEGQTKG